MTPPQKPGRSKQNYMTPPEFVVAMHLRLGITDFDIDLAAEPDTAQAPIYFTKEDDAFAQPTWKIGNGWNWLNPEYAYIEPWVRRAYAEALFEGTQTAVLIPASVGANWWKDHVDRKAQILLLNGRLAFMPDKPKWLYPKDCALLLYSRDVTPGYEVWSWKK